MDFRFIIIFLAGVVGGLYGSTVGGGALVTLPVLILTGLPIHLALGTQRLGALILEIVSSIRFHTKGRFNLKLASVLGSISAVGAAIGANFVVSLPESTLNVVVGILLVLIAIILLNKEKLGIKERPLTRKHLTLLYFAVFPLGIWGSFIGAGFGIFSSMLLLIFGFNFREAAASARVIGSFVGLVSAYVFATHGLIHYPYALTLGSGFAIGSWIGIGIALKRGDNYIKGLILLVIVLSVVKLISDFF